MSNTFNMVCGFNPMAPLVLRLLGRQDEDFPRFRDAYFAEKDDGYQAVVLTRTGEGSLANEEQMAENENIKALPGFDRMEIDAYDKTFAHWFFDVNMVFTDSAGDTFDADAKLKAIKVDNPIAYQNVMMKPMDRFRAVIESARSKKGAKP